jgi:hypothetical protein
MEKNKTTLTGSTLRKSGLIMAVLLTALSLSACVVAPQDDYRGGRHRHHWNYDGDWNGGGSGSGHRHH